MKRLACLTALTVALIATIPAAAQSVKRVAGQAFASDFQTIPVMANVTGVGGARFQSYVAIVNPTSSAYAITATLYDGAGTKREATINLAAGEQKTYSNFLESVFNYSGGGAVTLRSPESTGGTHNNRFIVNSEIWTGAARYGTSVPALEFAGTSSKSFAAGITVDSNSRTNIGCFNQSGVANAITAKVYDKSGQMTVGTFSLNLAANAWGQTAVTSVVTDGYVVFEPTEPAVCYAVIVTNATNDGHFTSASEFTP